MADLEYLEACGIRDNVALLRRSFSEFGLPLPMIPLKPRSSILRAQSGLFGPFVEHCRVGILTKSGVKWSDTQVKSILTRKK